jgi:hypothetical protein
MALILATVDTATARHLLLCAAPQQELIGTGYGEIGMGAWLRAWALVDPVHALDLLEEQARKPASPEIAEREQSVLELLTLPPAERPRFLMERIGPFWFPGEE